MKRLVLLLTITPLVCAYHDAPLTDPILQEIDGLPGVFDKVKIQNTLWLVREIKKTHAGIIKLDKNGAPNPRTGKTVQLAFKGKNQTLESLVSLEKKAHTLPAADQEELKTLFKQLKGYFGSVNDIMIADARGTQEFMIKLIKEFCRKHNRPHSILLNWDKGKSEAEMYEHDVVSFAVFQEFSTDLMNFLAALIKSCPKAFASFKAASAKKV